MAINYTIANTFTPNTVISSSEVNQNFSDNANTWTGIEAMSKTFSHIKMDADPVVDLEVATKKYVDNSVTASLLGNSKNRVLNGEMLIDQNNEGAGYITNSKTALYCVDQFRIESSGTPNFSATRSTESSPNSFFPTVLKLQTTLAGSPSAADGCNLEHPMDPVYMRDFGWGTSTAQTVTLSFWALAGLTGTYSLAFLNGVNSRSYVTTYDLVQNIWKHIVVTVPGDTTGPVSNWPTTGAVFGLKIVWDLGSGSNVATSTLGAWQAGNFWKAAGSSNLVTTLSTIMYFTGVQLEVGTSATSFEYSPLPEMLLKLQKYCWKTFPAGTAAAQGASSLGALTYLVHNTGVKSDGVFVSFPTPMLTVPTITYFNPVSSNTKWYNNSASADSGASTTGNLGNSGGFFINAQVAGDSAVGQTISVHVTANARLGGS